MKKILILIFISLSSVLLFATGNNEVPTIEVTKSEVEEGFTLYNGQGSKTTNLINNEGFVVHSWESEYKTGDSVYLLQNGNLLRTATIESEFSTTGGAAGRIEEFSWDGDLLWNFEYSDENVLFHHDIEPLENGNILLIAWEKVSEEDILNLGRNTGLIPNEDGDTTLWMDHVIEINRQGETVWEWHISDHLIQDYNENLDNYGVVSDHPELININFLGSKNIDNDWNHTNAVDYNPELDQILLSVRSFSEVWIIDHNTTTEEAKGSAGDLLYRWGNPAAYDMGDESDQMLFFQHDAQWIPEGYPGAGNILAFSNGSDSTRNYSTVEEFTPDYNLVDGLFGTDDFQWHYEAENPTDFYSDHISSAQRLENGNTLICSGAFGYIFEVDELGSIVWEYTNPTEISSPKGDSKNAMFRAEKYALDYPGIKLNSLNGGYNTQENTTELKFDIKGAATTLDVDLEVLKQLLGKPENGTLDYELASKDLNISVERLKGIVEGLEVPVVEVLEPYTVTINDVDFIVSQPMYSWDEIPESVVYEREPIQTFTNTNGDEHYYEVVYIPSINLDWYQASYLAEDAGGYQTCITTPEENAFVFSLIDDEKYFWAFPMDSIHNGIKIGPSLGGYQPEGSIEPAGGWSWLSGEQWDYKNWAINLDDGVIDLDPRDNSQPNDSANGQPVMGFGELNLPVPTWGDYTDSNVKPNGVIRGSYAFIIEYESRPTNF